MYRSNRILDTKEWFVQMENMLSDLLTSWNGMLILTGDFNINMLDRCHPQTI